MKKLISSLLMVTTVLTMSGVLLAPMPAGAATIVEGDLIKNPNAEGMAQFDVYIVKLVGTKMFKRLILSPHVFESYGHLSWSNIKDVDAATMDSYTTSDLVREINDTKVYKLIASGDTGTKQWVNMTAADFLSEGYDPDSIYVINGTDRDAYTTGSDVTTGTSSVSSTGTLTVTLAADTPASGIAVGGAARMPFTKVNLTATGGDVVVSQLIVERTGLGQDGAFSSLDIVDVATSMPLNTTSKTLNSVHQATFNDDFTVANGTTKSLYLAANMNSVATLASYAGEAPALALAGITVSGTATTNVALPITGNTQTINSTITIGTATVQRGAYTNATSTTIQVGKEDYTFFSFQVSAGSTEKVQFNQVKVYQEGSASLGSDVTNIRLYRDGTKIADGVVNTAKYVTFSPSAITLDKGEIAQFQVKADVTDGSARTIDLGIYRQTDILVKGLTYGYNITPTYSGTGSAPSEPYLSDNQFTISNGTLNVTRSSMVAAANIGVSNDQWLGAFEFEAKGEPINITQLVLTITSTGASIIEDGLAGVEFVQVDASGNVVKTVAGPTDPVANGTANTVTWSDTFTVPVGKTTYKVRADLSTAGGWASDETIYVSFTPSNMTATGDTTGNSIVATPSSSLSGNTQTIKAASLVVTRNSLPADATVIAGQQSVLLGSWNFDATAAGEDIRVTSVLVAGKGQASTNTSALTMYADDVALSPVNDALAAGAGSYANTSTFAFTDPIIVKKGTTVKVDLKGNISTTVSDATSTWGLTDSAASVIAYGVSTGNTVAESLTADDGATLTTASAGSLTVEIAGNPASAIVLAGSTGNVFSNVKLSSRNEELRLDQLIVHVGDGSYSFDAGTGNYQDVNKVSVYDGTTKIAEAAIPSTGYYTFDIAAGTLTIPKNGYKTLTIKADMATVDPVTDNAPGTNSADIVIGFGGTDGIKTTGVASNTEVTSETYYNSTSSAMVLRSSKPIVTLPTSTNRLGADESLSGGSPCFYAFKVTADASGQEVLLYRTTFTIATSGSSLVLSNVFMKDEDGNILKTASSPADFSGTADDDLSYWTATFNAPDVSNGDAKEALTVPVGTSKTYKLCGTVTGLTSTAVESVSTFLVGDTASTSGDVNTDNEADAWSAPDGDFSTSSNFIWSDNYKDNSTSGTDGNNATDTAQWYNGHLVPGLENAVSTTPYTISD